jgi:uncharacterized membrane protein
MAVDVTMEIVIEAPRDRVSSYSANPTNAPEWYENIKAVNWLSGPPVRVGSKMSFVAFFLGKRLEYTYEVAEFVPGELLVMRTAEGPFPMETTYAWADAGPGRTKMTLRNRGEPTGFSRLFAGMMARSMTKANRKDLANLKRVLEAKAT